MAFDALLDVLQSTVEEERLEKERAAVLSEASMINKMEYRVECQILSGSYPPPDLRPSSLTLGLQLYTRKIAFRLDFRSGRST